MGSISVSTAREGYAGISDAEIARSIAIKDGYHVIVAYTNKYTSSNEHTNWGLCTYQEEVNQYLNLKNATVLYDDGNLESMQEAEGRTLEWLRAKKASEKKWWQFWK